MRKKSALSFLKIPLCISAMVTCICSRGWSQDLRQQFTAYAQQVMQEKLYAHTDKNFYVSGEICWFKIYNVDAFFNKPLGISKLAYIELLDKNNKAVLQAKVALKEANGNGSLQLPVSLPSGKYLLRAYTRWMKNFSAAYFFEKPITVINTRKIFESDTARQKNSYDIQFFPEGGNMVNGLQSRVAFRVTDQSGKGVACNGAVINEQSDTVARYNTLKFGLGSFLLTMQQGHSYKAVVVLPDGSQVVQALPAAYNNGYVMQLIKDQGRLKINVSADAAAVSTLYLFAHTRGSVKAVQTGELKNGHAEFFVDTAILGNGISHFTVFNSNRQPVCERLFFKRPVQQLQLTAATDLPVYEARKKVTIDIGSSDEARQPLAADMSMAVYRIDSLTGSDEMDISNYLWLSADLTGNIESPGYYFSSGTEEAADNLMLTQGWRRFRWEDVLQNRKPSFEFSPEFKGHIIKGKVLNSANGQPVSDAESYITITSNRSQVRGAYSNDSGNLAFEMNNFYGNNEIIVQTAGKENRNRHIDIISPFADKFAAEKMPLFFLPEKNAAALFNEHVAIQVQNTYTGDKLAKMLPPPVDTTAFYAKPDKVYMLDDYVRFTTVEEILREYVPDVNVRKRDNKFYLPVFDDVRKEFFTAEPMILLDGLPILDPDKIMSYDPLKIQKLEVVSRLYYYGGMFFGGIINFITYHGDMPDYELDPYATVIDYGTLQSQREFFAPVYETQAQLNGRLPDFRSLLYWSPTIKTSGQGKQSVVFYTSDLPGSFAAVLQGITANGQTGSKTVFFQVEEKNAAAGKQ